MRRVVLIFLMAAAISSFAADTKVKGYLVDMSCGREEGSRPDFGIKHSRECLQMPECVASGYGILTDDKKIIQFDAAGNEQAKKFIADLKKNTDIKVTVTGSLNGSLMTVTKIELQ
jgi:hypothetical protein